MKNIDFTVKNKNQDIYKCTLISGNNSSHIVISTTNLVGVIDCPKSPDTLIEDFIWKQIKSSNRFGDILSAEIMSKTFHYDDSKEDTYEREFFFVNNTVIHEGSSIEVIISDGNEKPIVSQLYRYPEIQALCRGESLPDGLFSGVSFKAKTYMVNSDHKICLSDNIFVNEFILKNGIDPKYTKCIEELLSQKCIGTLMDIANHVKFNGGSFLSLGTLVEPWSYSYSVKQDFLRSSTLSIKDENILMCKRGHAPDKISIKSIERFLIQSICMKE